MCIRNFTFFVDTLAWIATCTYVTVVWKPTILSQLAFQEILTLGIEATMVLSC